MEESPDEILGKIACPTRINCVLYKHYPADKLPAYVERFLPYNIPIQFRYDYTETTPENLYQEEGDKILVDLKKRFAYKGLDGCRMRNGYHFDYKGLHMTYHKTLPYSTIVETGDDGVTYDILYDILIKQTKSKPFCSASRFILAFSQLTNETPTWTIICSPSATLS